MAAYPVLKNNPTLSDIQAYVTAVVYYRGFDKETVQDSFIMLTEEVGELAKALRKQAGVKVASDSKLTDVKEEAVDVFWMLICICNLLGIDLELALRAKEAKNKTRSWQ